MEKHLKFTTLLCLFVIITAWTWESPWKVKKYAGYKLYYQNSDQENVKEYNAFFKKGKQKVKDFFNTPFKTNFSIYVHPNRASLDSTWQKDWKMPQFKSQCWMVASGVSHKLDIISPKRWDKIACEHIYAQKQKTQRLITHEMFHVFHGQFNKSPDFSNVQGIDWFIEGFATYASGQCDQQRLMRVKQALSKNEVPTKLDKFWKGKLKYGLSGSVVMYLDQRFGRKKLKELLQYNTKEEVLKSLNITEDNLLKEWKAFMQRH